MFKIKKTKLFILKVPFFIIYLLNISPLMAATSEPILSIVQSQENANQWTGITNRLQTAGVKYCIIPLANVQSAGDWGERKVLFLPNVEVLTPAQAIALEEWMSKGGRLIASGPAGSLSAPGVRQLLQTLLGGYWGFSLNGSQQLQPSKAKTHEWASDNKLFGNIRGGVVVPDDVATAQTTAVWNSKDNPAAVVSTDRSTFFGWRWGVDAASPASIDTAWLQATLKRYLATPSATKTIEGSSKSCSTSVVASRDTGTRGRSSAEKYSVSTSERPPLPTFSSSPPVKTAVAPQPRPIQRNLTPQRSDEAIDKLEQQVRLNVAPNSQTPINSAEAIALQQELEHLIGRVQSANLAASVISDQSPSVKAQQVQVASTRLSTPILNTEQVLAKSREVAKNLQQLIAQKKYAEARQQWLMAKADLWQQFPVDRRLAQPEIRAMWLDRGTIVRAGSEQRLAQIFDRMAQAGVNTVFFETINAGYTIYPSQIAPQQNPLSHGWDPLAAAVKLAHERGMELHAWVWTFAAGNKRHNEILNLNPDYLGPVLANHPDWADYDNRGQTISLGQSKPFFDPANLQVRQYLLSLYEEIVTRYKVDGLQLDYIRYPFQNSAQGVTYGYGKAARAQFQQLTGVDPVNISPTQQDLWQKWTEFRTQQVDSFVAQVSQQLRQKQPNLILSVAVFPLPELERIQKIQQHWEVWAQRGDVDIIVPMTYAQDTLSFERLAQPWLTTRQLGSTLLVPGIRLLSMPTLGTFDQIQQVRDSAVSGYALFAAENFSNDLYKVFNSTQGSVQHTRLEPIPQRQPFQTAAARYTTLQQEWKLIFQNNQLRVPATMISDFNSQAELLQSSLNQLAAEPNTSRLIATKASLARFQSQFREWMHLQAIDNPYQVKVWENHLTMIEKLLRYGERKRSRF
ncbi:MAG: family 10 glycosylhydrolase [Rhizonema sp. PD38]|nr:family 10 glycosylhydrolase [Rhizonema sp. PD38]